MVYQFRSMCKDGEEAKSSLLRLNRKSIALNIRTTTARCIGRLLPKFQIDQWPQLWKVLRGDVSLVGPRPVVLEEVEPYQSWQRRHLRMRLE